MKHFFLIASLACSIQFAVAQSPAPAAPAAFDESGFSGKVIETMSTAGYTYVRVDTGAKKLWAAAPEFSVKTGDKVTVAAGAPMPNYHSKTLNRDFDVVYFTGGIKVETDGAGAPSANATPPSLPPGHPPLTGTNAAPALPPGHPPLTGGGALPPVKPDLSNIKKADGGKTVAEIVNGQTKLAGKSVTVRGKIVKYNAAIMGKNWLHIQDGSGDAAKRNNDLTVTTATEAKIGDTVLVTGTVSTNKDFGAGYKYSVILDDATVKVE